MALSIFFCDSLLVQSRMREISPLRPLVSAGCLPVHPSTGHPAQGENGDSIWWEINSQAQMVGDVRRETASQKGQKNQRGRRTRTCADGRVDEREIENVAIRSCRPICDQIKKRKKKKHQASGRDDYSRQLVTKVPANEWAIFSSIASIVPSLEWQKCNNKRKNNNTYYNRVCWRRSSHRRGMSV